MNDRAKTTILLVEDDALLRKSLSRFIGQKGYLALEAENGYEAMKIFKENRPALVLTDLRMPVMDGFDLINEIKAESPKTPIIIFSGVSQKDTFDAVSLGACDYITKPIKNIGSLIERIEKALVQAQRSSDTAGGEGNTLSGSKGTGDDYKTGTKTAEEQVALLERQWQTTADILLEPIAILDRNHLIIRANRSMARLLGKTLQDLVGLTCHLSSTGFDNPEQAANDFAKVFSGRDIASRFADSAGVVTYEITIRPYYAPDDETVAGCVYLVRETTER